MGNEQANKIRIEPDWNVKLYAFSIAINKLF